MGIDYFNNRPIIQAMFNVLDTFIVNEGRLPKPWNYRDAELFYNSYFLKSNFE